MIVRVATWNLNTWITRARKNIALDDVWEWADDNLRADLVIFTEAPIAPPASSGREWSFAVRPGGFPGRSKWGTIVAGDRVHVNRRTHVGDHELDRTFPGSLTVADTSIDGRPFATVVGLYLPYRKDASKTIISHPESDLHRMADDLRILQTDRDRSLVVAGDLNYEMRRIPSALRKLGRRGHRLVDPFASRKQTTFRQDWRNGKDFRMDYLFLSRDLARQVVSCRGGIADFPDSLQWSDHAPLVVDIDW